MHIWFFLTRGMTLGVRVFAQDDAGKVLLIRHTYVKGWHLPGGGVELGESVFQAAEKELLEETGYEVVGTLDQLHIFQNMFASRRDHVVLLRCGSIRKKEQFVPTREIAEIGFFPPDELPIGVTKTTRRRIVEITEQRPFPSVW